MDYENKLLKFMDCTASQKECDDVAEEIALHGNMGSMLIADAASLLYYTDEELSEFFTPDEIAEIRELGGAPATYVMDEEPLRMVAEEEEPYGAQ